MILYKSPLIFGAIKKIFVSIFKIIYKVLALFNLQLTLFVGLISLVLYLTGTLNDNPTLVVIVVLAVVLSLVYAVYATLKKVFRVVKKQTPVKIVKPSPNEDSLSMQTENTAQIADKESEAVHYEEEKPVYYKVKQDSRYVMAEYSDRYELLLKRPNGLVKVRTDYKKDR